MFERLFHDECIFRLNGNCFQVLRCPRKWAEYAIYAIVNHIELPAGDKLFNVNLLPVETLRRSSRTSSSSDITSPRSGQVARNDCRSRIATDYLGLMLDIAYPLPDRSELVSLAWPSASQEIEGR
ncbi:1930_t:CDS:2 [Paraglomus occultum]|uniref:1930_t:CDS:1 n=1 Tax=Paraglomus occultum TaxID=144539 RepID=A0A9N9FHM7_9GLOM|nr:1930_t:CDS:2 [Paraglomus occultum]